MHDPLDQLAEQRVPPPPRQFDARVYQRLNNVLLTQHLVELVLRAFPAILADWLAAVHGLLRLTLTGRFDKRRR